MPINTLLETIHKDRGATKRRLKVWWGVFLFMFFFEWMPEFVSLLPTVSYPTDLLPGFVPPSPNISGFFLRKEKQQYIMPLLIGVSVFCLADNNSLVFSNIFGGATANEGLGIGSISFDWNYIASFYSPLWYPLKTSVNQMLGIFLCWVRLLFSIQGITSARNIPSLERICSPPKSGQSSSSVQEMW